MSRGTKNRYRGGVPISKEHAGRSYPASQPYLVTKEAVARFADSLGDSSDTVPPTFAMLLAARTWDQLFSDPELGLSLSGTIHGDQAFVYHAPLRVGDEVTATLTIDNVRVRGTTEMVKISVLVATVGGRPVCTAKSTLIHTREAA